MQSPYNSKSMKNKFSTIKGGKNVGHCEKGGKQIDQLSNNDDCKRCSELLNLLKSTRFLAR